MDGPQPTITVLLSDEDWPSQKHLSGWPSGTAAFALLVLRCPQAEPPDADSPWAPAFLWSRASVEIHL